MKNFFKDLVFNKKQSDSTLEKKDYSPNYVYISNSNYYSKDYSLLNQENSLYKYYTECQVVNDAVDQVASSVSSLIPVIKERSDDSISESREAEMVYKFIQLPNLYNESNFRKFIYKATIQYLLSGELNIFIGTSALGKPLFMYILESWNITNISNINAFGLVKKITFANQGSNISFELEPDGKYKSTNKSYDGYLLRSIRYNPENLSRGQSYLSSLKEKIIQILLADDHNTSLLSNGARPSGALIIKEDSGITSDQRDVLRQELEATFQGTKNSGRPMILEGQFEWQEFGKSLSDMDFVKNIERNENAIYNTFGIPLQLKRTDSATFNNMEQASLTYYKDTVLPLFREIVEPLNRYVIPMLVNSDDIYIDIDMLKVDVVEKDVLTNAETMSKIGAFTINEIRQQLDFEEIQDGDTLLGEATKISSTQSEEDSFNSIPLEEEDDVNNE